MTTRRGQGAGAAEAIRGSVLVIVLWITFGLVSMALYFGHSMSLELKAADHRVAGIEAGQAVAGAARSVAYLLGHLETNGILPEPTTYPSAAVAVGDGYFWLVGRDHRPSLTPTEPYFALVDEASKLNLNTASAEMLQWLPRMTAELAAAIVDWRDTNSEPAQGGAEDETYLRLNPPYHCKNAPFESVEELRLVAGMDLEILYGEDTNQNGVLDPNENDGDASPPYDNKDGRLDPGLVEYVTVHSRESNVRADGSARVNLRNLSAQQLGQALQSKLSAERVTAITRALTGPGAPRPLSFGSVLEFYIRSGMTEDEFVLVADDLTASAGNAVEGLININSASEAVLACIPGIGTEDAPTVTGYRQSNPGKLGTVAWLVDALGPAKAQQAGPYVTVRSYQFTADVAAVGHHGRGFRRERFIFDTTGLSPRVVFHREIPDQGWALGRLIRQELAAGKVLR